MAPSPKRCSGKALTPDRSQTPAGTIEATGNRVSALGTLWVTFEGDKAREVTHHLDVLAILQQVGALPG